jgi:hypothetical protein
MVGGIGSLTFEYLASRTTPTISTGLPSSLNRRPIGLSSLNKSLASVRLITATGDAPEANREARFCTDDKSGFNRASCQETKDLLQGAYKKGDRDPMLVSTLALFLFDIGDTSGGQTQLEENPKAVTARPLASLELAQQHLNYAMEHPSGSKGKLGEVQAAMFMGEVSASFQEEPPMLAAYTMAARVLLHFDREQTALERTRLTEGAKLFSEESDLVIKCVVWNIQEGEVAEAHKLIELGL